MNAFQESGRAAMDALKKERTMLFTLKDILAGLTGLAALVGVYVALATTDADLKADNRIQDARSAALEIALKEQSAALKEQSSISIATFKEVTQLRLEFAASKGNPR